MIKISNLSKSYFTGEVEQKVINDISLEINDKDFIVILGPSGSGKTTFLNIIAGLETAEGEVFHDDVDILKLKKNELRKFRAKEQGYIFQEYLLLENLSVLENVMLVAQMHKKTEKDVIKLLKMVDLENHKDKLPSMLSGGQKQRVSIVRALIASPKMLICDEPTGALDTKTSVQVLKIIKDLQRELDLTIIMVTHNEQIAKIATRVLEFKDGKIRNDITGDNLDVEEVDF